MKQILLLLLAFAFFGCRDESPEPDLSAGIKGTYQGYVVIIDSQEYPFPFGDTPFIFELIPKSANTCILRTSAIFPNISDTGEIELTLVNSGSSIELLKEEQKIGLVTGNIFEFYFVDYDGTKVTVKAKKM